MEQQHNSPPITNDVQRIDNTEGNIESGHHSDHESVDGRKSKSKKRKKKKRSSSSDSSSSSSDNKKDKRKEKKKKKKEKKKRNKRDKDKDEGKDKDRDRDKYKGKGKVKDDGSSEDEFYLSDDNSRAGLDMMRTLKREKVSEYEIPRYCIHSNNIFTEEKKKEIFRVIIVIFIRRND